MRVESKSKSELKERSAALNTQLRFGRERQALVQAYKLRTYIQLRGAREEAERQELERVERVIAELETRKSSGIQRLIKTLIEMGKAALNPEVDDEPTLLDRFRVPTLEGPEEDGELPSDLGGDLADEGEKADDAPPQAPLSKPAPEADADGWGWGGESVATSGGGTDARIAPRPAPAADPVEEDYWGGGEGYSYDDKF